MFREIYNILVEILGESKQGGYSKDKSQFQFDCPRCAEDNCGIPDHKYNLEVCLSPKQLVYKCWKCHDTDGTYGKLSKLIKKYGNAFLYARYKDELNTLIKSKLYDINAFNDEIADTETFVKLPDSYTPIPDINQCPDWRVRRYLALRGITQDIVDKYRIGYTTWDDSDRYCRNRIVVPSYDEFGDLNYWSARDFTGKAKAKYKNCDAEKTDIIFQEHLIDWDSDIILCEGTLDAIYVPFNGIALLGKTLNKNYKLFQSLMDKANGRVIICLDGDTDISETKKIYSLLNSGRLYGKIYYIRLEYYKDFGELYEREGKKGMMNVYRLIKQFDEIDLVL